MPPRRRIDPAAGERAYRLALQALRPQAGARATAAPAPAAAQAESAVAPQAESAAAHVPAPAAQALIPPPGLSVPGLSRPDLATAVRFALEELASRAPGGSVELRVPPFGVTQLIEGPRHTRGTPPNVVETDPVTFLCLTSGHLAWADATATARLHASGSRADLAPFFPLSGLEAR
ncbi:sterol carrier family protein [Buchananella felis]|uniref:sterol carrier family protein n=1 Tax=Buchananella felis TaxID=3231492 RepID=UPI00352893FE